MNGIFTGLSFDFNNEDIVIDLHNNACDVDGVENLDPNDTNRINIYQVKEYVLYSNNDYLYLFIPTCIIICFNLR